MEKRKEIVFGIEIEKKYGRCANCGKEIDIEESYRGRVGDNCAHFCDVDCQRNGVDEYYKKLFSGDIKPEIETANWFDRNISIRAWSKDGDFDRCVYLRKGLHRPGMQFLDCLGIDFLYPTLSIFRKVINNIEKQFGHVISGIEINVSFWQNKKYIEKTYKYYADKNQIVKKERAEDGEFEPVFMIDNEEFTRDTDTIIEMLEGA